MAKDNITFNELIDLLNQEPAIGRTLQYIIRRNCRTYAPFDGQPADRLLPYVQQHKRLCFNCNQESPEHRGRCWGNASCEIWTCQDCIPLVEEALQQAHEQAKQQETAGENTPTA